jgi:hypothetical protein
MSRRGAVLYVFLFVWMALVMFLIFTVSIARRIFAMEREQTVADMTALASARLRIDGLERVAARWATDVGKFTGEAGPSGAFVASGDWPEITRNAGRLPAALSGYKGRSTAVIKVVTDANRVDRDEIEILDSSGAQLNLVAEPMAIYDESGQSTVIPGGWLRRDWTDLGRVTHRYRTAASTVRVGWDVDLDAPRIRDGGNGGYPREWLDALHNGRLDPNRVPLYRAELAAP